MVRGLADIVQSHGLDELVYDTSDLTLTLKRSGNHGSVGTAAAVTTPLMVTAPTAMTPPVATSSEFTSLVPAPASVPVAASSAPSPERTVNADSEDDFHVIKSPFVGTFYRRPSPEADTYVTLGARVSKGQVLCIVEAMKLMNEIESDLAGTVADILVEDAQPVEYGQPLFKIVVA